MILGASDSFVRHCRSRLAKDAAADVPEKDAWETLTERIEFCRRRIRELGRHGH